MNIFIYYIYAYINKKTGLPYYVGKGKNNRAFNNHGRIKVPKDKSMIVFMETNLSNIGACALERRYINWYGRKIDGSGILLNYTEGGESNAVCGELNFMYGKKGELSPNYGTIQNEKWKEKRLSKIRGRKQSLESRIKMSKNRPKGPSGKKWFNNGIFETYDLPKNKPNDFVFGRIKRA